MSDVTNAKTSCGPHDSEGYKDSESIITPENSLVLDPQSGNVRFSNNLVLKNKNPNTELFAKLCAAFQSDNPDIIKLFSADESFSTDQLVAAITLSVKDFVKESSIFKFFVNKGLSICDIGEIIDARINKNDYQICNLLLADNNLDGHLVFRIICGLIEKNERVMYESLLLDKRLKGYDIYWIIVALIYKNKYEMCKLLISDSRLLACDVLHIIIELINRGKHEMCRPFLSDNRLTGCDIYWIILTLICKNNYEMCALLISDSRLSALKVLHIIIELIDGSKHKMCRPFFSDNRLGQTDIVFIIFRLIEKEEYVEYEALLSDGRLTSRAIALIILELVDKNNYEMCIPLLLDDRLAMLHIRYIIAKLIDGGKYEMCKSFSLDNRLEQLNILDIISQIMSDGDMLKKGRQEMYAYLIFDNRFRKDKINHTINKLIKKCGDGVIYFTIVCCKKKLQRCIKHLQLALMCRNVLMISSLLAECSLIDNRINISLENIHNKNKESTVFWVKKELRRVIKNGLSNAVANDNMLIMNALLAAECLDEKDMNTSLEKAISNNSNMATLIHINHLAKRNIYPPKSRIITDLLVRVNPTLLAYKYMPGIVDFIANDNTIVRNGSYCIRNKIPTDILYLFAKYADPKCYKMKFVNGRLVSSRKPTNSFDRTPFNFSRENVDMLCYDLLDKVLQNQYSLCRIM